MGKRINSFRAIGFALRHQAEKANDKKVNNLKYKIL